MSIQIFQDSENIPGLGKKNKRGDENGMKTNIPKPTKRVALGNITNQVHGHGSRIQPSRAAKDKHKASYHGTKSDEVKIFENKSKRTNKLSTLKDSPMILSLTPCTTESFEDIDTDEVLPNILNIDQNTDSDFDVPEYAQDIHNYLKKAEMKFLPKRNYMEKQVDINKSMRSVLIDWLVEVAEEYKLNPQTLFLTVNYIDRFLSCMSVLRGKLQLVGTACMLVASKFEEIYPPEVSEFVYITDDTYTAKQVLRMESLVLKTLQFDVSVPTCKDFLNRYLLAAGAAEESQLRYLSQYLTELSLVNTDICLTYRPSTIAAASVLVANNTLKLESWTPTLQHYSGYTTFELKNCATDIRRFFANAPNLQQQAVQQKYKAPKFGCVSQLSPPQTLVL
ncbi:G2/mitotic-specific cyclin-A-like isoform X1 [Clytia hemisphaerica]|uniref:Cyclin A n=1 Tax=Clytia hemisphaerica TaxID=252671 RepID=A0A7M5V9N5_9CNID